MKLFTIFITLTVTLSAYAQSLLFKRAEELNYDDITPECRDEVLSSDYANECEPELSTSNYKEYCPFITSEKCQTYYNDPLKYYPHCKDVSVFKQLYNNFETVEKMKESYKLACQTDENGEICPYSKKMLSGNGLLNFVIITQSDINDQCKSKKCTKELYDILKNSKYNGNFKIVDMLEKCNNSNTNTSNSHSSTTDSIANDSHKLKSHNFLFMTLSLLLLIIVY